ncbi:MAG TPA: nuclear transport factor 2 family protein [Rhodothermales bacterium]|nr:nuclear transport factor 2 family protein [Rhodothermales bacterium]
MATKKGKQQEQEQEIIDFLNHTHEALTAARRESGALLSVRRGEDAVKASVKAGLSLGEALDSVVDDFEASVDDRYTYVDPNGVLVRKRDFLQGLRSGRSIFDDFARADHEVRFVDDIAIVTNRSHVQGEVEGQSISGSYVESHILQRQDQGWTLLASQVTPVVELNELVIKAVDCDDALLAPGTEVSNPPLVKG